jgi:very-short-patch-repair endonuclease
MGFPRPDVARVIRERSLHGAISREHLLAAGVSSSAIHRLRRGGHLETVHDGVYLVADTVRSPRAKEAAALVACAPDAHLSRLTAGRLWELPVPTASYVSVTVEGRYRSSFPGVRVSYVREMLPQERREIDGLSVTSPALTLLDLMGAFGPRVLVPALNEARIQGLVTMEELDTTTRFHWLRPGSAALRAHLARERGPEITRSEAERRALELMKKHGIVPDESDYPIGPYRVDFYFRRERVAVEIDGYRYHSTPERFVHDRRRTAYLASRGIIVFPLVWDDIVHESANAMTNLTGTLAGRRHLFDG